MKLLWKILLPTIVLIAVLLSAAGYISYSLSAQSLQNAVIENLRGAALQLRRTTTYILEETKLSIDRIAHEEKLIEFLEDPYHGLSGTDMVSWLESIARTYPSIDRLNVFDLEGNIVSSSDAAVIGQNFKNRDYFIEALKDQTFISEPFKSAITNTGVVIVSSPVRSGNAIVGVVDAIIQLQVIFDDVFRDVQIGDNGYAYAINHEGTVVVHDNLDWLFNTDLPAKESYRLMAASTEGGMEFVNNFGQDSFSYFAKMPVSDMSIVVQAEKRDIFSELDSLSKTAFLVVLAGIVLGIILVSLLITPVVRVLNRSVTFATEVANGNLDGTLEVDRKDEIGVLAGALQSTPASLKAVMGEYRRLENELIAGNVEVLGDPARFSGDFANLIEGTNAMMSRYQLILKSLTAPVMVLDKDLRIAYLNDAAVAMVGAEALGKPGDSAFPCEDDGTDADALRQALRTLQPAGAETIAHPLGKTLEIAYYAVPFLDKHKALSSVLLLITDLTQIKSTQRTIIEVASQAQDISNRVATSSEELSSQVEQVTVGADIQRERASSTATAMVQMNSTVLEVARNAGDASQQAEATREKASEGAALVNQVVEAINEVNTVAGEVQKNMEQLGRQAESIGSVMNVISDIADQTNLLALNAAIEAARAGEAGRGFAVVADEVRKLAEKTMGATTEVGASIRGIQESTSVSIERVGEASRAVVRATELATVSGEALENILGLVNDNSALISEIATAAEQQSATSDEISRAIEDINRIADETAGGMSESSVAVHDLSRMAQDLRSLLERLRS